jgi:hypothetical protein
MPSKIQQNLAGELAKISGFDPDHHWIGFDEISRYSKLSLTFLRQVFDTHLSV